MTKEVIEVPFEGVAVRKLHDLFERGYTVCGVAIQRIHQSGNFDRGAITTNGMVMWWQKLFSGDELEASNVQHPNNALQLAEALHEMANTYLPTGGDFVPAPRSKADELMDDAAAILRSQHARIAELEAENSGLRILASGGIELFERYSTFKAKCEELEAMLDAVGAGGVGQSIKPQVQADAAQEPGAGIPASVPTGWKLVPMEPTAAMLDAAFDTEVVHTEWGVDAFVENTAEVYGAMLAAAPEAPAQQKPVAHLPCCGYADTSALKWNPYNSVAQCHNCGQVYAAPPPPAAQQEPVAWLVCSTNPDGSLKVEHAATWKEAAHEHINDAIVEYEVSEAGSWIVQPAYTAPQPPAQSCCTCTKTADLHKAHEPAPQQKPVAILDIRRSKRTGELESWGFAEKPNDAESGTYAVYTAPQPARQPLTEDQLRDALRQCPHDTAENLRVRWLYAKDFARSIEAAHGITGSQQ